MGNCFETNWGIILKLDTTQGDHSEIIKTLLDKGAVTKAGINFEDGLFFPNLVGQAFSTGAGKIDISSTAHSGKNSIEICAGDAGKNGLTIEFPAVNGRRYAVSVWVHPRKGPVQSAFLTYGFRNGGVLSYGTHHNGHYSVYDMRLSDGRSLHVADADDLMVRAQQTDKWQRLLLDFEAESAALMSSQPLAVMLTFGLDTAGRVKSPMSTVRADGCVLFDDIVFEEVARDVEQATEPVK